MRIMRNARPILVMLAAALLAAPSVVAQDKPIKHKATRQTAKPRNSQKTNGSREKVIRVDPSRTPRQTTRVKYLTTGPRYRHVRIVKRSARGERIAPARTVIVHSTSIRPRMLIRFDDRRQQQIRSVIRLYRDGRTTQAVRTWGGFVAGLADYGEPVDLDEIMLYVSRECCFRDDDAALFYAQRLAFLRDAGERLDDYVAQLENRRSALIRRGGRTNLRTLEDIDSELARARAERKIAGIRERLAGRDYETSARASRDYEHHFDDIFTNLYREADSRLRLTITPKRKTLRP